MKYAFIYLLMAILAIPSMGADGMIDYFTSKDGLVHDHVTTLHQDKQGYLWVGTWDGVSRFDGRRFLEAAGPEGRIVHINAFPDGQIFVVGRRSVHVFLEGELIEVWSDENANITDCVMDKKGRLWLKNQSDILKMDNKGNVIVNPGKGWPSSRITSLMCDQAGRIWVGFRQVGLARYDEKQDAWLFYGDPEGLPAKTVNNIYQTRDGVIWVTTLSGAVQLYKDYFTRGNLPPELQSGFLYNMIEDAKGALWFTTAGKGLIKWDGKTTTQIQVDDGLASNTISSLFLDRAGRVLAGTANGLSLISDRSIENYTDRNGLSSNRISCYLEDNQNNLWVGSQFGLNRFEEPLFITHNLTTNDTQPPAGSMIHKIVEDKAGNLWFPGWEGLARVDVSGNFKMFTKQDGLPSDKVFQVDDADGVVWAGSDAGLAYFKDNQWHAPKAEELSDPMLTMKADHLGRMWFWNRDRQILVANATGDQLQSLGLFENLISIKPQKDGSVWLESLVHLVKYNKDLEQTFQINSAELMNRAVALDKDGVWWLGEGESLTRWKDGKSDYWSNLGSPGMKLDDIFPAQSDELWINLEEDLNREIVHFKDGAVVDHPDWDYLSNYLIDVFVEEDGTTWLLSRKGVSRVDENRLHHLTVSNGMAGSSPEELIRDQDGVLWIATNGGLNMYHKGLITAFSQNDGLYEPAISDIAQDTLNRFWVRTKSSIARFKQDHKPPQLELVTVSTGDQTLPNESGLKLRPRQKDIAFSVRAIDLSRDAADTRFAYELSGNEDSWQGNTREEKIPFHGLAPGKYLFKVTAVNRFLQESQPVTFEFVITPPIWMRPWFLILAGLVIALLSWLNQRSRLERRLEKDRIFNELQTARQMQMSLMPLKAPKVPGYSIFGVCIPANEVGGDYFDYFWLEEEERLGLAILDVSGKSMGAAMIAVMNSGLINAETGSGHSPGAILTRMNYPMYMKTGKQVFSTGLICDIHLKERKLTWGNAGHADPLVIRDGKRMPLPNPTRRDIPLGGLKRWNYGEHHLELKTGDVVLLFTDGLDEAMNPDDELFGAQRIIDYVEKFHHMPPAELATGLLREIKKFEAGAPRHDDMTLIVLKVKEPV